MNSKDYISSGKLENYVFGSSSSSEILEVERMCAMYPEIRKEKLMMEEALRAYVDTLATRPPKEIKERIMQAIKLVSQESNERGASFKGASKMGRERSLAPILWAASIALIFGFGINHYIDSAQVKSAELNFENEQEKLILQKEKYANAVQELQDSLQIERNYADFILHEATEQVLLAGTDNYPRAKVKVFYNDELNEFIVKRDDLPSKKSNSDFQLWAIADGTPVDLGVLDDELILSNRIGIEKINKLNVQAFAITIEPKGGSVSPTLENMVVIGNRKV